ncbi:unnamed protein product [Arctogadus glacialis]
MKPGELGDARYELSVSQASSIEGKMFPSIASSPKVSFKLKSFKHHHRDWDSKSLAGRDTAGRVMLVGSSPVSGKSEEHKVGLENALISQPSVFHRDVQLSRTGTRPNTRLRGSHRALGIPHIKAT